MSDTSNTLTSFGVDDRLTNIVRHFKAHKFGDQSVDLSFLADTPKEEPIRILAEFFDDADRRPDEVDRRDVEDKYKAFTDQLAEQFTLLRDFGYSIEVVDHDPFDTARELVSHVREVRELPVMSTDTGDFPSDHPLTNRAWFPDVNGRQLCWNDLFRWVHDILGHVHLGADNAPFTLPGEWRTWKMHAQMFSGDAKEILATEAIAQIAWMDSAPRFDGDDRPIGKREFPPQKIVAVPNFLIEIVE